MLTCTFVPLPLNIDKITLVRVLKQVHNTPAKIPIHKRIKASLDRKGVQHQYIRLLEAAAHCDDDGGWRGSVEISAR